MAAFCESARRNGIDPYYWFSPIAKADDLAPLRQVMTPADEKRFAEIKADKDPPKHGYQFGGEPLPGRHDVLLTRILCFHRPEVVAWCRQRIRQMLEACPALAGVAFDYFGYQNYRCCMCPHSLAQFEAFCRVHPDLPRDKALDRFSRDSLVAFTNDLAAFVRQIKPDAKLAIHVYPVFLPEPLYGNRLDVDYCCQTVAWFFKPYWSREKITRYTRVVVNEADRYHSRQQGIPFVGVYVGRVYADKSAARLAEELRVIYETAGTTSLSVCSFNEFVKHAGVREVVASTTAEPKPARALFRESFEDADLAKRGWYDATRFRIAGNACSGKGCIEYEWTDTALKTQGSAGVRRLFEPTTEIYLRFYLKLSQGWGWTRRNYHPHLVHFLTTENSKWHGPAASHLTLYIEPVNGKLRLAAQDIQNKNMPHGLTQGPLRGGYNGKFYDSQEVLFKDDKWHCVEAYFKLNTLDFDRDRPNRDGVVRGWFDGKLVVEQVDAVLRSTDFPEMMFNQFLMAPYFGPGLLPHAQKLWIDELIVGVKRIGPLLATKPMRAAPGLHQGQ